MHDKGGTSGNGNSLEFSQDSLKFGEFELVPSGQNAIVARGANSEVGIGVRNQFQALESDVREGDVVGLEEVDVGVPEAVALVGQSKGLTEQGGELVVPKVVKDSLEEAEKGDTGPSLERQRIFCL